MQEAAAAAIVRGLSPSARLVYALGGTQASLVLYLPLSVC
jgi:hypothetical protein